MPFEPNTWEFNVNRLLSINFIIPTAVTNLETLAKKGSALGLGKMAAAALSATLGLGKAAMAALVASLPFLKIIAPVVAIVTLFRYLYNTGWSFGDVLEAMGDNLKRFGIGFVDIWLSIAEKIAKFVFLDETVLTIPTKALGRYSCCEICLCVSL